MWTGGRHRLQSSTPLRLSLPEQKCAATIVEGISQHLFRRMAHAFTQMKFPKALAPANLLKPWQVSFTQNRDAAQIESVRPERVHLNSTVGDRAVASAFCNLNNTRVAAPTWAREMFYGFPYDLFQLSFGLDEFTLQAAIVEIRQIGVSHRVAANLKSCSA